MHYFWSTIIQPIFEAIQPKNIIEIGSDRGDNTLNLLKYCQENNAKLHVIDPLPQYDVDSWQAKYGELVTFHLSLSLHALPLIERFDLVLIDGDHNWYTVFNELKLIEKLSLEMNQPFPLILLHDIAWPYARRDLYYNPDTIPEEYRQPYEKKGMRPGRSELLPTGGLNSHLNNAIYENKERNGVLTAIEDFLTETQQSIDLVKISGLHGLGLLIPPQFKEEHDTFTNFVKIFSISPRINKFIGQIEAARLETEFSLRETNSNKDRRMEKLLRILIISLLAIFYWTKVNGYAKSLRKNRDKTGES